jgi:hypothetical protein
MTVPTLVMYAVRAPTDHHQRVQLTELRRQIEPSVD